MLLGHLVVLRPVEALLLHGERAPAGPLDEVEGVGAAATLPDAPEDEEGLPPVDGGRPRDLPSDHRGGLLLHGEVTVLEAEDGVDRLPAVPHRPAHHDGTALPPLALLLLLVATHGAEGLDLRVGELDALPTPLLQRRSLLGRQVLHGLAHGTRFLLHPFTVKGKHFETPSEKLVKSNLNSKGILLAGFEPAAYGLENRCSNH